MKVITVATSEFPRWRTLANYDEAFVITFLSPDGNRVKQFCHFVLPISDPWFLLRRICGLRAVTTVTVNKEQREERSHHEDTEKHKKKRTTKIIERHIKVTGFNGLTSPDLVCHRSEPNLV